jgi:hypothetical protein
MEALLWLMRWSGAPIMPEALLLVIAASLQQFVCVVR